jgi:RNA polymerase sigma-70 factor (ECF subfamily)
VSGLSDAFLAAAYGGDVDRLAALLTDDITYVSDGGAQHHAARRTVHGPEKVARLLVNLAKRVTGPRFELHRVEVDGQSALYLLENGEPSWLRCSAGATAGPPR